MDSFIAARPAEAPLFDWEPRDDVTTVPAPGIAVADDGGSLSGWATASPSLAAAA